MIGRRRMTARSLIGSDGYSRTLLDFHTISHLALTCLFLVSTLSRTLPAVPHDQNGSVLPSKRQILNVLEAKRQTAVMADDSHSALRGLSQNERATEATPGTAPPTELSKSRLDLEIPEEVVSAVEHPCIVRNIDQAVKAFGGMHQLKHIFDAENGLLHTSLRPNDPFSKQLLSRSVEVEHVLLRLTLPRRTGRKRKRGSNDDFEYYQVDPGTVPKIHRTSSNHEMLCNSDELVRMMAATQNPKVQAVGIIPRVHRFRSLPDFQHISQDNVLLQSMATQLIKEPSIASVKAFQPDMTLVDNLPISAPPRFGHYDQPLHYAHAQNRYDPLMSAAPYMARRRQAVPIAYSEPSPDKPPPGLEPLEKANKPLQQALAAVNQLLHVRPITTRRAALNLCSNVGENAFKDATQYTTYAFRSGPWRDTHVRFGLDPRRDPEMRKYQTLSFQYERGTMDVRKQRTNMAYQRSSALNRQQANEAREKAPPGWMDHLFDGQNITTVRSWQILDITEPQLKHHFETAQPNEEADELYGWYGNGTIAIARIVIRDMIDNLSNNRSVEDKKQVYELALRKTPREISLDRSARPAGGGGGPGLAEEELSSSSAAEMVREGMVVMEDALQVIELVQNAYKLARAAVKPGFATRSRGPGGRWVAGTWQDPQDDEAGGAPRLGQDGQTAVANGQVGDEEENDQSDDDAVADLEAAEFAND